MPDDRYWTKLEDMDHKLDDLRILVAGSYVTRKEFGWVVGTIVTLVLGIGIFA